jgi:hypothetical protein
MLSYQVENFSLDEEGMLENEMRQREMVKIMLQALHGFGLEKSLASLERESGLSLESEE